MSNTTGGRDPAVVVLLDTASGPPVLSPMDGSVGGIQRGTPIAIGFVPKIGS